MGRRELFLSHSAADVDLAEFLDLTARKVLPDIDVFRTTRVGGIPAGREWFAVITQHLRSADFFLVLLSEASMRKPWVCFETGAAWFTERPLVPLLVSGLKPDDVPEPLRLLQLLSLDEPEQASQAFRDLGGHLPDPAAFVERARELAQRGRIMAVQERFQGITFDGAFYAYEGPFNELPQADPVPMPEKLPAAFRDAGFDRVLAIPARPETTLAAGYKKVWLIDAWNQKRPLLSRQETQQLYVKPSPSRNPSQGG